MGLERAYQYFVKIEEKESGPFTYEQLVDGLSRGHYHLETQVRTHLSTQWKNLAQVPGIEEAAQQAVSATPSDSPSQEISEETSTDSGPESTLKIEQQPCDPEAIKYLLAQKRKEAGLDPNPEATKKGSPGDPDTPVESVPSLLIESMPCDPQAFSYMQKMREKEEGKEELGNVEKHSFTQNDTMVKEPANREVPEKKPAKATTVQPELPPPNKDVNLRLKGQPEEPPKAALNLHAQPAGDLPTAGVEQLVEHEFKRERARRWSGLFNCTRISGGFVGILFLLLVAIYALIQARVADQKLLPFLSFGVWGFYGAIVLLIVSLGLFKGNENFNSTYSLIIGLIVVALAGWQFKVGNNVMGVWLLIASLPFHVMLIGQISPWRFLFGFILFWLPALSVLLSIFTIGLEKENPKLTELAKWQMSLAKSHFYTPVNKSVGMDFLTDPSFFSYDWVPEKPDVLLESRHYSMADHSLTILEVLPLQPPYTYKDIYQAYYTSRVYPFYVDPTLENTWTREVELASNGFASVYFQNTATNGYIPFFNYKAVVKGKPVEIFFYTFPAGGSKLAITSFYPTKSSTNHLNTISNLVSALKISMPVKEKEEEKK